VGNYAIVCLSCHPSDVKTLEHGEGYLGGNWVCGITRKTLAKQTTLYRYMYIYIFNFFKFFGSCGGRAFVRFYFT
jgi:hypothetical protein